MMIIYYYILLYIILMAKTKKNKIKTKKNKIKIKKTKKNKPTFSMKLPPVAFYKKAPNTTTIGGFPFLLLPLKCNTFRVECKLFGGNYLESKENSGISHLLEHVLTNSWKKCYKKFCSLYLEKYGTISNAHTSYMNTHYWIQGLAKFKNILLTYLLSIILQPFLIEKTMTDEIEAVRNELHNYINRPEYHLNDVATKELYKISGLRYTNDCRLQLSNLKTFSIKQLIDFSHKLVSSKRLLFVVSGSFEKKTIIPLIENIIMGISPRTAYNTSSFVQQAVVPPCYDTTKKVVYVKNKRNENSTILFCFPIPIYVGDKDVDIVNLITSILGSGLNSLLVKQLRLMDNLIYGVHVVTKTDFCGTLLTIKISTMHKHVKLVITKTLAILKKYSREKITNEMLQHYKLKYLFNLQSVCLNTPVAVSNYYTDQFFYQLNLKEKSILTLPEKTTNIHKITLHTICNMFKKVFDMQKANIFYMSNKKIAFDCKDLI